MFRQTFPLLRQSEWTVFPGPNKCSSFVNNYSKIISDSHPHQQLISISSRNISRNKYSLLKTRDVTPLSSPGLNIGVFRPGTGSPAVRWIRTSVPRRGSPAVFVLILGRFAKVGAMIGGRFLRRWWQKLTPEERLRYRENARRGQYFISGTLGALAVGSFVFYKTHIEETPFTNRKRFLLLKDSQVDSMSKYELGLILEEYKDVIIPTGCEPAYRRVASVARRLIKANQDVSQIHDKKWTVTVVDDDDERNAFVLPCGAIFVFSGMLNICDLDDELAVILGHEMAHVVLGHTAEKASFLHFMEILMLIPLAAVWAFLPTDVTAAFGHWVISKISSILVELPHSRFIEHEADQVGLLLAAKACFDIRVAPVLWEKMGLTDLETPIEWLSTHPTQEKRQAQLEELIPQTLALRDKCQCPRLPYFDPAKSISDYKRGLKERPLDVPARGV